MTDRGQTAMDRVRDTATELKREERDLFERHQQEWQDAVVFSSRVTWGSSLVLLSLIGLAGLLMSRDHQARETENWLRSGQMAMSERAQGEQRLQTLGENALAFLTDYLDAPVGAVYIAEGDHYRRVAAHALPPGTDGELLRPGDGLVGQVAKTNRTVHVTRVPEGYLPVASSLGRGTPAALLIAPATVDGVVQGVIELGFFRRVRPPDHELLGRVTESLGVAIRASKDRTRLEELLEETTRQAEELQTQQEELRVNNEELEEQGSALRESLARLEAQQSELEQINAKLEQQAQVLARQKADLTTAQGVLADKAAALERANEYKSEFLANMSHELRTPLNSSLILAKLLADNKEGNLTAEQVKFAQTISAAGNDLLALINDILDLSRIEAGKVEVSPEPVVVARLVEGLVKTFHAVADDKGLQLTMMVEPGTPERLVTDPQRLGQILKNLLANALKFTDSGAVTLRVSPGRDHTVLFAVRDTGIGIPAHQHGAIFEAFRQADGSTHRRFGGTGLGLSISRDLARLLGGDITLESAPDAGSVFTLKLPTEIADAAPATAPASAATGPAPDRRIDAPAPTSTAATVSAPDPPAPDDERDRLTLEGRRILVVEDDLTFAEILCELAREKGFQCVMAHSASDGLAAALTCRPSAILLDINLPDHSGLGVLDQLKRDPRTRHIPVHVMSGVDYTREALERGAIGYGLKPVKREQLVEAFQQLEAKFSQTLRRVLVVEDDDRQREGIRRLLEAPDVEITGVKNAADALRKLQAATFDCMVIDLNLPDVSGHELLQQMAGSDGIAFPPVIVYTGRSLSAAEEHRAAAVFQVDHHQGRALAGTAARRSHPVPPPDGGQPAGRAPAHAPDGARPRGRARRPPRAGRRRRRAQHLRALERARAARAATVEIARNGREASRCSPAASAPRRSTWCSWTS